MNLNNAYGFKASGADGVAPMNIDNYPWTIYAVVIVMPENRFRK